MARLIGLITVLVAGFALGWYVGEPVFEAWANVRAMARLPAPRAAASRDAVPLPVVQTTAPPTVTHAVERTISFEVIGPRPRPAPTPPTPPATPTPPQPTPAAPGAVTLLLLGVDARPGEGWVARSDTIMVARLDPVHQRVALLSLPRDLWVTIPGAGQGKLNSAFFIGEQQGQGAAVAQETVSELLGIPVPYTAVIDFAGFRSVIDSLGGIPVNVPRELYDPQFPTDDNGYTVAHFLSGPQTMDGAHALMFSRIRHPDSDFERMRRQQLVLVGIAHKIRDRGILQNVFEADRLTGAVQPYLHTNLPPALGLRLLWSLRSIDVNTLQHTAADSTQLRETSIGGAYALVDPGGVLRALGAQLVEQH